MNDEQAEAQKARVMAVWDRWATPLGMGYQRKTSFTWCRGPIDEYPEATMTCYANWKYKEVDISVDLKRVANIEEDSEVEYAVLHEIMHVFLRGLVEGHHEKVDGDAFRMIEEHTATNLAQALLWIRSHFETLSEITTGTLTNNSPIVVTGSLETNGAVHV